MNFMPGKAWIIIISVYLAVGGGGAAADVVQSNSAPSAETDDVNPDATVSCAKLADDFCSELWNQKNKGNMKVPDGEILLGKTGKSETRQIVVEDLKALIDGLPRMPADLRKAVAPAVAELKETLTRERFSEEWPREMKKVELDFASAAAEVAEARLFAQHPEFKNLQYHDRTIEQRAIAQHYYDEVNDQVIKAKYAESPRWKRIESLFRDVRQDLIDEVQSLPIPEEDKAKRIAILSRAELTLPYQASGMPSACGSTQINAFYSGDHRQFVVCAGLFNGEQSKHALYVVIAHELSHSIDPVTYAIEKQLEDPAFKTVNRLTHSTGPAIDCREWDKAAQQILAGDSFGARVNFDPLAKLSDCLASKKNLKPYTPENVRPAVETLVRMTVDQMANEDLFLNLAQPTKLKDGKEADNEFYMRPDRLEAEMSGNRFLKAPGDSAKFSDIFSQVLACESNGDFKKLKGEERTAHFDAAIKKLGGLAVALLDQHLSYCGQNCGELTTFGLSSNPQENFADWLAFRAFTRVLEREKSLSERRRMLASAFPSFCPEPSPQSDAPDLAFIEKKYSIEPHDENRKRRLAAFNERNAQAAQCKISPVEQGYSACKP